MGAFDRKNFYNLTTDSSGEEVLDPLSSDWESFREGLVTLKYHTVNQEEAGDLPLISFKEYGKIDLWWVLAQANNIIDPFSQVVAGMELTIPTEESVGIELRNLKLSSQRASSKNKVQLQRKTV